MPDLKLHWYQRDDGLWNAKCTCVCTLAGFQKDDRAEAEIQHFKRAELGRTYGADYPPCGIVSDVAEELAAFSRYGQLVSKVLPVDMELDSRVSNTQGSQMTHRSFETNPEAIGRIAKIEDDLNACSEMLSFLNVKLGAGQFDEVDRIMGWIDVPEFKPSTLLALVTMTSHALKDYEFIHRGKFIERVNKHLRETLGEERAAKLMNPWRVGGKS